ncbi:hypothetical protein ACQKQA_16585 [Pseudomonas sp. NPDC089530]|uniref:hypothetical protein n=1 Tax=Pseudomonas sp. NPDC089530 TaxID=3390651 RepID=UPI003CFDFCF9
MSQASGGLLASHLSDANIALGRALIGAGRLEQVVESVAALQNLAFGVEEVAEIDRFAREGAIKLWEKPSIAEWSLLAASVGARLAGDRGGAGCQAYRYRKHAPAGNLRRAGLTARVATRG